MLVENICRIVLVKTLKQRHTLMLIHLVWNIYLNNLFIVCSLLYSNKHRWIGNVIFRITLPTTNCNSKYIKLRYNTHFSSLRNLDGNGFLPRTSAKWKITEVFTTFSHWVTSIIKSKKGFFFISLAFIQFPHSHTLCCLLVEKISS